MTTRPLRPALLVIDMQNDFLLPGAPMEVPEARDTVAAIAALLAGFRQQNLPVIFTRYIATPHYRHHAERHAWLRLLEAPVYACTPGHMRHYPGIDGARDGAAMIDALLPQPGEVVIDKPYFSAFHETELQQALLAAGAEKLVITGTVAEMCVEDTARHALHFGWPVQLIRDAVSSNEPEAKQAFLRAFARNYGEVCDTAEALSQLC